MNQITQNDKEAFSEAVKKATENTYEQRVSSLETSLQEVTEDRDRLMAENLTIKSEKDFMEGERNGAFKANDLLVAKIQELESSNKVLKEENDKWRKSASYWIAECGQLIVERNKAIEEIKKPEFLEKICFDVEHCKSIYWEWIPKASKCIEERVLSKI